MPNWFDAERQTGLLTMPNQFGEIPNRFDCLRARARPPNPDKTVTQTGLKFHQTGLACTQTGLAQTPNQFWARCDSRCLHPPFDLERTVRGGVLTANLE